MLMEHLTSAELETLPRETPVLIPFGSVEEHGPHLPLATDVYTIYGVAELAAREIPLLVAPPVYYGLCRSTSDHPGTLSLRGETLRALVLDLLASFYRQGFRRFLLVSGHAGGTHMAFILDAAEEFLSRHPEVRIAVASILDLLREAAADLVETPNDAHAGEWETSLIQHFYPHLVKGTAPAEYPRFPKHILVARKRSYWPGGVWGDPAKASPEKGRDLALSLARGLKCLVKNLEEV
ncbi:MAG TPA: creatininase family protein [Thermosulfurimonas dismutans]|uniref:Creatininase family protein n=1 Tax=Thermosulfurimonas dismutans TaxID=999894 RepID=A0A7C3CKS6_9BACT|nr:creatininase family protein [Thermosulfurimonas dismutans]